MKNFIAWIPVLGIFQILLSTFFEKLMPDFLYNDRITSWYGAYQGIAIVIFLILIY